MMDARRILGYVSLLVLILLCFYSMSAAPSHWRSMPPLIDVVENAGAYEGREFCVDGIVLKASAGGFTLSPVPAESLGTLSVKTETPPESASAAHVCGRMAGGVLSADEVIPHSGSVSMDVFLNLLGLIVFLFFALKEWKLVHKPMFIAPKDA
jgi:hypothetical protein